MSRLDNCAAQFIHVIGTNVSKYEMYCIFPLQACVLKTSEYVEEYCGVCIASQKLSKCSLVSSKVKHVCGFFWSFD